MTFVHTLVLGYWFGKKACSAVIGRTREYSTFILVKTSLHRYIWCLHTISSVYKKRVCS